MPKLKTTQQQPDIGEIEKGKDPVNSSDPWPAQESRGDCSGISRCWLLPAAHLSRGVFVPVGWAAGRSCLGALWQEEGNSKLCHSEADLGGGGGGLHKTPAAGLCTNTQNLATELGSFWRRLCRVLVPSMICESEDQLVFPMEVLVARRVSSEILGLSV